MDLSIILPTLNEKENIVILLKKIIEKIPKKISKEIIIIDDNSEDGTFNFIKKKFKNKKFVKVFLRKSLHKSLGASIGDGIKKSKGNLIVIMDSDLSHNPNQIPIQLKYSKKYDLVSSSRYIDKGNMENKLHFYCSYLYNIFLGFVLKTNIKDNTGGFFCVRKKVLNTLPFKKIFFGYGDYFFRLLFFLKLKKGIIKEIPTKYTNRLYGKSKSNFFLMIFKYFISAVSIRFNF